MKKYTWGILTLTLIAVALFCTSQTVMGQGKAKLGIETEYYHEMEQAYVKQVRAALQQDGYENAGVYMTMIVNENGSREYTLHIHHARIDKMEAEEREQLCEKLSTLQFPIEDSNIQTEFVAYNC